MTETKVFSIILGQKEHFNNLRMKNKIFLNLKIKNKFLIQFKNQNNILTYIYNRKTLKSYFYALFYTSQRNMCLPWKNKYCNN